MSAIEIRDVTKQFDQVVAVNRLTLSVPPGSIYGFIGLFQLFWLFAAGLKYEQRESEKHYDAEWRRR